MLKKSPSSLIAGSSELFIYFKNINEMYSFGPYKPTHATAATFAFKRKLLTKCRYNETACLAEEKEFLKNYTIPMVQLDPKQVILVFSHSHNTFDKKELLKQPDNNFRSKSSLTVDDFIKEPKLKQFYLDDIEPLLENYKEGRKEMKPDVIQQTKELRQERIKAQQKRMENSGTGVKVKLKNGIIKELTTLEIINILDANKKEIIRLNAIIDNLKNIDSIENSCL
jgi:hypothetical protein